MDPPPRPLLVCAADERKHGTPKFGLDAYDWPDCSETAFRHPRSSIKGALRGCRPPQCRAKVGTSGSHLTGPVAEDNPPGLDPKAEAEKTKALNEKRAEEDKKAGQEVGQSRNFISRFFCQSYGKK